MSAPLSWCAGGDVSVIGILSILVAFSELHQEGGWRGIADALEAFRANTLATTRGRRELATFQRECVVAFPLSM